MNYMKNIQRTFPKICPPPPALPHEIPCPVCQISLARHPNPRTDAINGHGQHAAAMRNEIRDFKSGKVRDADLVVVAPCGHMFHRFCLRHYCFVFQQTNTHTDNKIECPVCLQDLSMVKFQNVDYKAHLRLPTLFDQEYNQIANTLRELETQMSSELESLDSLTQSVEDQTIKLEAYRNHQKSLLVKENLAKKAVQERNSLRERIKDCNEGINSKHQENLNIIKMYTTIMMEKSEDELQDSSIPQSLIPYLALILEDESLLQKFGEVLRPIQIDGLSSNTTQLIKEILAEVEPKFTGTLKKVENRRNLLKPTGKPVVVKVQHSNVSIFSRTELDDESLRNILRHVKGPINKLHDTHQKFKTINNRNGRNQKSILTNRKLSQIVKRSVSDIQVLFESRKNKVFDPCLVSPLESDADFLKSRPQRRCKSTEPVLMKTKEKKAVVVKANESSTKKKGLDMKNAVGDGNTAASVSALEEKPEVNKELCSNVKLDAVSSKASSTKSCRTCFKGKTVEACLLSSTDFQTRSRRSSISSRTRKSYTVLRSQEGKSSFRNSTARFTPHVSESGFEMMCDDDRIETATSGRGHDPLTTLVDDVSKITFGTYKRIPCQNLGVDGNVNQPVIEYTVSRGNKVSSNTNSKDLPDNFGRSQDLAEQQSDADDIENGWRLSETQSRNTSVRNTNEVLLQGILPGPNLRPAQTRGQQELTQITGKVPIYQSKWSKKLPSTTRTDFYPRKVNLPTITGRFDDTFQINEQYKPDQDFAPEPRYRRSPRKDIVIDIPSSNSIITTPLPPPWNCAQHPPPLMDPQIQRPISPIRFHPSMSQSTFYNGDSRFAPQNGDGCQMQNSPRNSHYSIDKHDLEEDITPYHQPFQYGCDHNNLSSRGTKYGNPNAPPCFGDADYITSTRTMENAFVELCRELSPPRFRSSRPRCGIEDEYDYAHVQNNFSGSIRRRNYVGEQLIPNRLQQRRQPASARMICPDGISPRVVRKAKRKQHQMMYA